MTISTIFTIVAVILFIFAALGVNLPPHPLEWGLAAFAFAHLPLPLP